VSDETREPFTLERLQKGLRFGQKYTPEYFADPRPHRDLAHAAIHMAKVAGKLAALVDTLDHTGCLSADEQLRAGEILADAVIIAARAASVMPAGAINLDAHVWVRAKEKDAWREPEAKGADHG
jgi:hypothetical protein